MEVLRVLTPPELIILQKHIELGKDHLINFVGKKGFEDLLALARLDKNVVKGLKIDNTETAGNLILTVNTIITGSFGGWMGLCGMLELGLGSSPIFYGVLSLATLLGALIGYQSVRLSKSITAAATEAQQLLQLKSIILKEVHTKRNQEMRKIEELLQSSLRQSPPVKNLSTLAGWSKEFDQVIEGKLSSYKKSPLYSFLQREATAFRTTVQRHLGQMCEEEENIEIVHPAPEERTKALPPILQKLTSRYPQTLRTSDSWTSIHAGSLILSLIPTLFGGLGSVFFYLTGSMSIARAFEQDYLVAVLTTSEAKFIKIIISILVTTYFGFLFLYTNRNRNKRAVEIEKKQQMLVTEEAALTLLDEKLFKLRKIKGDVEKIVEIFQLA